MDANTMGKGKKRTFCHFFPFCTNGCWCPCWKWLSTSLRCTDSQAFAAEKLSNWFIRNKQTKTVLFLVYIFNHYVQYLGPMKSNRKKPHAFLPTVPAWPAMLWGRRSLSSDARQSQPSLVLLRVNQEKQKAFCSLYSSKQFQVSD